MRCVTAAQVLHLHQHRDPRANRGNHTKVFLTFHHVLLVVTVIVTVRGPVIDVEAMDWGVVVTCWDVLREWRRNTLTGEQRDYQVWPWGTGISPA